MLVQSSNESFESSLTRPKSLVAERRRRVCVFKKCLENDRGLVYFRWRFRRSIVDDFYANWHQLRPQQEFSSLQLKALAGYSPKCQNWSSIRTERLLADMSIWAAQCCSACIIELIRTIAVTFVKPRCRPASKTPHFSTKCLENDRGPATFSKTDLTVNC